MATKSKANGSSTDIPMEELSAQINALKTDLAKLTQAMGDVGKATAEEAKEMAASKLETAKTAGANGARAAQDQAKELHAQANDFVVKQPGTALAIAAGAGFLMGFMSSRK